jgi:hypothetical protein
MNDYSKKNTNTKKQKTLFDVEEEWEEEWKDMPEFVQEKQEPFATIKIRFETEDDLKKFSEMIEQKLTQKTQSIWFPFRSHWGGENTKKRWRDES